MNEYNYYKLVNIIKNMRKNFLYLTNFKNISYIEILWTINISKILMRRRIIYKYIFDNFNKLNMKEINITNTIYNFILDIGNEINIILKNINNDEKNIINETIRYLIDLNLNQEKEETI